MHAVFAGAQIHRAHGQSFHDSLYLIRGETIGTGRITVAKGTREIAFVGEPEAERNSSISQLRARSGLVCTVLEVLVLRVGGNFLHTTIRAAADDSVASPYHSLYGSIKLTNCTSRCLRRFYFV